LEFFVLVIYFHLGIEYFLLSVTRMFPGKASLSHRKNHPFQPACAGGGGSSF